MYMFLYFLFLSLFGQILIFTTVPFSSIYFPHMSLTPTFTHLTEHGGSGGNVSDSCCEGAGFESRPGE
jgi:hypothetical protein